MPTKLGTIFTDFTARTLNFEQGVGKVRSSSKSLSKDLTSVTKLAAGMFAGVSAAVAVREIIQITDANKRYAGQLALVTKSSQEAAAAQAEADRLEAEAQQRAAARASALAKLAALGLTDDEIAALVG